MANTTYIDVVTVFEATFQEKKLLSSDLVRKWFDMALEEFSAEIEPLTFSDAEDHFVYLDKDGNEVLLPNLYTSIIGYTIKKYYCERQYDKVVKRTNILGNDLKLNNTDADKKNAKAELDYVNEKISDFYDKLKPTAYA
jgi:hypothetical protein